MSSSIQNHSPMQWLLTQLPNSLGLSGDSGLSHQEEQYYYPQDFIENITEPFLNFESPTIQGLKALNSSTKTLQNILNTNIFKKPFVIWNTNSEGDHILHKSNCLNISEGTKNIIYNHNLELQKVFVKSERLQKKSDEYTVNNSCPFDSLEKLGSPKILFLELKNRMVTSSSNNESVLCNVHPQISKKKLKNSSKQLALGDPADKPKNCIVETQKETFILSNPERNRDQSLVNSDLSFNRIGVDKRKILIENKSVQFNEPSKILNGKQSYSSQVNFDKETAIKENVVSDNGPKLQIVEKILEDVLWKRPTVQNSKRDDHGNISSGGSDTGYSSRCSTPPSPANSSDSCLEKEVEENRLLLNNNVDFHIEKNIENSPTPSECSENSQWTYQSKPKRKYNFQHYYHNSGYHNSYGSNAFKTGENVFTGPKHNNRVNYNGNNNYRCAMVSTGYRKVQNGSANSYNSNQSSHFNNNVIHGSCKNSYTNNPRHFNQNMECKNNWTYNQRQPVGRGRQYLNPVYNNYQSQSNQHQHIHTNGFQSNNSNSHVYYQLNPQYDIREVVQGFQRKLTNLAGIFTINRSNGKWGIDHRAEATIIPPELLTGSQWDDLSLQVWKTFSKHQQLESTFRAKMELKDRISRVIWNILPMCRLFVVGSSLSGFGANSSDVDMCLMVTPKDLDQRNDAQAVLRLLQRELNNCGFAEKMELITAKVPILKFRDSKTGIDVDLNCNNSVGIRNTHLLNAYSQLDWRVRPLVLVVKLWAQHHNINNAKDMTISSYSLVLMVIHYLQVGTPTPLLPCLHKAYPDKFNSMNHVFKIPVTERMALFVSNNKQTLGELFLGFLEYYADKFKFIDNTISVRVGGILPTEDCRFVRTKKNDSRMWKYLCIEEPFDLTNTARSVYDEGVFEKVKNVFKDSINHLKKTKNLNSIFQ